jgi:hypothetical protein
VPGRDLGAPRPLPPWPRLPSPPHPSNPRDDITLTLGSVVGVHLSGLTKYQWLHRSLRALTWLLYSDVRLATLRMWESQAERRQLRCAGQAAGGTGLQGWGAAERRAAWALRCRPPHARAPCPVPTTAPRRAPTRPLPAPARPRRSVRWCVMARSRLPFLSSDEPSLRFEAISTYRFDSRGRIFEHSVDRIIPPESPVARWLEAFVNWQGAGRVPAQQPSGIPVPGGGGGWGGEL